MSEVSLYLGDCLDFLPTLPRDAAIVSDPPFGIAYQHRGGGKGIHAATRDYGLPAPRNSRQPIQGDSEPFDPSPWLEWPCLLWGANHFAARLPEGGSWLAWDKSCGKGPEDTFADGEFGWCSVPGVKRNVCRYLWKGLACVKKGESNGRRWHPMQKPVGLMLWSIDQMGLAPGTTIIDPYMGSGTTGVAAVQLGYHFIGIEVDPAHFATAERRIAAARAETPLFAENA